MLNRPTHDEIAPGAAVIIMFHAADGPIYAVLRELLEDNNLRVHPMRFEEGVTVALDEQWYRYLSSCLTRARAIIVLCRRQLIDATGFLASVVYARWLGKALVPATLDDFPLPAILGDRQGVILRAADRSECARIVIDILRIVGRADTLETWDMDRVPYPGLRPLDERDAAVFFGRSDEIAHLVELLESLRRPRTERIALLVGASGCGKSSLLRAGLIPRLRNDENRWLLVEPILARSDMVEELSLALSRVTPSYGLASIRADLLHFLRSNDSAVLASLITRARVEHTSSVLVIIIDQLEQSIHTRTASTESTGFDVLSQLARGAASDDLPMLILGTLRGDFLDYCADEWLAQELPFRHVILRPMPRNRLAQVIEGPAARAGLVIDPLLVDKLVSDTGDGSALPLLAYSLRRLYDQRLLGGGVDDYETSVVSVRRSISSIAESIIDDLRPGNAEMNAIRKTFLRLVELDGEGRFRARSISPSTIGRSAMRVLSRFLEKRLLIVTMKDSRAMLEVAHEALFEVWEPLREWLQSERTFYVWYRAFRARYDAWHASMEPANYLLEGVTLDEAQVWWKRRRDTLGREERTFLAISAGRERMERDSATLSILVARAMAHASLVEVLESSARTLWPCVPENVGKLTSWLASADKLDTERPARDELLRRLTNRSAWLARSVTSHEIASGQESAPHASSGGRRSIVVGHINMSTELEFRITQRHALERLANRVNNVLRNENGLRASVIRRLHFASTVSGATVSEYADEWKTVAQGIADSPEYGGLRIRPQVGLIPLGRNESTGYYEFLHLQSHEGPIPRLSDIVERRIAPGIGIIFVLLPRGHFRMGAQKDIPTDPNYDPYVDRHESGVCDISVESFFISKFQMTQAQWSRHVGTNPSRYQGNDACAEGSTTELHPVENVSWNDVTRTLFELGLELPTEADWEYAARGQTTSIWWCGDTAREAYSVGRLDGIQLGYEKHAPIGCFRCNGFGLFDVVGNVAEMCAPTPQAFVPSWQGPPTVRENECVARGGSFGLSPIRARSASRACVGRNYRIQLMGIRPVRRIV